MPKTFMTKQLIQKIRKLTIGQGKNYTTGCLLDYEYIKNHCRNNSSWVKWKRKRISCRSKKKKNQQIWFFGQ